MGISWNWNNLTVGGALNPPANAAGTYGADGAYTPISASSDPDQTMGTVLRSQWADYLSTYQPVAAAIMDRTTYNNPSLANELVGKAATDVNSAFDSSAIQQRRQFSRFGVAPTAEQQAVMTRSGSLGRSSAIVDAANNIRMNLADRNRAVAVGGIPNITSQAGTTSVGASGGK